MRLFRDAPPPEAPSITGRQQDVIWKSSCLSFLARHGSGGSQHGRGGLSKPSGIDRDAGLKFIYLVSGLAIRPRHDPTEGTFDPVHIAVIPIIDLNRIRAD